MPKISIHTAHQRLDDCLPDRNASDVSDDAVGKISKVCLARGDEVGQLILKALEGTLH
jgi:hypothetical protein